MTICALIVAGGKGSRMESAVRKQYLPLGDLPVIGHTLRTFDHCELVDRIVLVVPASDLGFVAESILPDLGLQRQPELVAGGSERQASVANGLAQLTDDCRWVMIHDGVRPFVRALDLEASIDTVRDCGACILAVPAVDTPKSATAEGRIVETLERRTIWLAQTPQTFAFDLILNAHRQAHSDAFVGTDDAQLVERLGHPVRIVSGHRHNIKITTPDDLAFAELLLTGQQRQL